jgi:serine/threonine-protein kinase
MAIRKDDVAPNMRPADGGERGTESRLIDGRFELREVLGNGGMASVYRAWDRRGNAPCAVKVLAENLARDQDLRRRFRQEAEAANALVHPRIVRVYAHGELDSTLYMVMEYVEGGTLCDLLRRRERLPESLALRLAAEVADALAYAHDRHVVHRDIKPHNILLTPDTHVKVTDFGIARTLDDTSHTKTGTMLGSMSYISPEQARGEQAGPASDQYSLGVVLYEALAGRLPFEQAESPVAMALKHINEPPFDLQWLRPELSEETVALVRRLLAKSPKERFGTAAELAAALRRHYARFGKEDAPTAVVPLPGAAPAAAAQGAPPSMVAALARGATIRLAAPGGRSSAISDTARTPAYAARPRRPMPYVTLTLVGVVGLWLVAAAAYQAYHAVTSRSPGHHPAVSAPAAAVRAPSLVGRMLTDAQRIGASHQLTVAVASSRQDPHATLGTIVAQDPPANAAVAARGTIHVVVSQGSGIVPRLHGLSVDAARQALGAVGLRVGSTRTAHDDIVPAGMITDQSPGAATHLAAKSPVDLVVSQGPNNTATPQSTPPPAASGSAVVPSVTGTSLSQAQSMLRAAGLQVGQVSYVYDGRAAGIVIQQQTAAGTHASANDAVSLVVSKGPQPQPTPPPAQPASPQTPSTKPAPPQTPPSQHYGPPQSPPPDQSPAPPQSPPDNPPSQTTP